MDTNLLLAELTRLGYIDNDEETKWQGTRDLAKEMNNQFNYVSNLDNFLKSHANNAKIINSNEYKDWVSFNKQF